MYTTNVALSRVDDSRLPCQFFPSSCYPIQSPSPNASCCRLLFLFLARRFALVNFPASLRPKTLGLFCSELSVVCRSNLAQACAGDKGCIVSFAGWGAAGLVGCARVEVAGFVLARRVSAVLCSRRLSSDPGHGWGHPVAFLLSQPG